MGFEKEALPESKKELKIFSLSRDDFKKLFNLDAENPKDIKFMEEKGISFDMGDIIIKIDGEKKMMTTKKEDFGTLLTLDTIEMLYGKKTRDEMNA